MSGLRDILRPFRSRAAVYGRPHHEAAHVETAFCRVRWLCWVGVPALLLEAPLMHLGRIEWRVPHVLWVAHAVAIAGLLTPILVGNRRLSIRQARAVSGVAAAAVVVCGAMLIGGAHFDPRLIYWLSLALILVNTVTPLPWPALAGLTGVSLALTFAIAWLSGWRPQASGQVVALTGNHMNFMMMLSNTVLMGAFGIALNLWQVSYFRQKWKAELTIVRRTHQVERQVAQIERQRARADKLLDAALTKPVADELRRVGRFAPAVDEVCVVSCDIVGFSKRCEQMPAALIVHELQRFFAAFDRACEPYDIEPMRSQGDSVLAVSGLHLQEKPELPNAPIDAVLAMLEFQRRLARDPGDEPGRGDTLAWSARIGIHVGSVMMGVVDGRRLTFDIWGEPVNIASRLQQAAPANGILVSQHVLCSCRDLFEHDPLQPVRSKNTQIPAAAVVHGIRPAYRDGEGRPNEKFWRAYGDKRLAARLPHQARPATDAGLNIVFDPPDPKDATA